MGWKFLPPTRERVIEHNPLAKGFEDVINTRVEVHLGFIDRIRVLLMGKLIITTVTLTERKPGRVESHSGINTA